MERKPLLITFEGIDGCGKSTQAELFAKWLPKNYGSCILTKEPGGTEIGAKIRKILLDPENDDFDSTSELLLYAADRAQHVNRKIKPYLQRGVTNGISVVSDRFYDSTTAYQGYGRGLDLELINKLNLMVAGDCVPDVTFLIDTPVDISLRNVEKSGKKDRLENEKREFYSRIRKGFLDIADQNKDRVIIVPYLDGIMEVQDNIRGFFRDRYL